MVPRRTQEERTADSAERLMQAAIDLIAERGWERTTIAEISRRAGYSKAMVSVRYGGKDALLESLQRSYEERFVGPDVSEDGTGLERVLAQITTLRIDAQSNTAFLRAFLTLCFETVGPVAGLRPWITDWFARYVASLAHVIATGQADGSVDASLDPAREAQHFLDTGTGICFSWILGGDIGAFDQALADWQRRVASHLRT